jgi:hypothetical protein
MRFQYSASEAVAPLGGQNVTRELSEAPELLLDSVLNPVSVASLSTAPIREPKGLNSICILIVNAHKLSMFFAIFCRKICQEILAF